MLIYNQDQVQDLNLLIILKILFHRIDKKCFYLAITLYQIFQKFSNL